MSLIDSIRTSAIGQRVRNVDWEDKTSGAADYTGDLRLPGMLFARILRSDQPHAKLVSVDLSRTAAAPGVVAVVTPEDLPDAKYVHHGGPLADRTVLAQQKVRYVGEEIGAVAAESLAEADAALRLARVRYERLPAYTDVDAARGAGAVEIHDGKTGNISMQVSRRWGAPDARPSAVAVSGRYHFGRQTHVCMEPNSVVASWDPDERRLEVWISTQSPVLVRKELAGVLGLSPEQIVMHEIQVGGGFGSKSKISEFETMACLLSMKAGRPVRLVLSREEEFATTKSRHNATVDLTTSATTEGDLISRRSQLTVDNGAYNHSGPSVMGYATLVMGSLYRTDGVEVDAELVYTNKHPGGQFRGYGSPQVTFAIESQMDELANELGMDPIELRIRNANQPGDVTHTGWRLDSARLEECLRVARDAIGWEQKRSLAGSGRGVGFAAAIHVSGAFIYDGANQTSAAIDIHADGRLVVRYGGADAGTWQKTLLAQFAAEELRTDVSRFSVLTMETEETPLDLGAWSTRGTYMSGHALSTVGRSLVARLTQLAAGELGEPEADLRVEEGEVRGRRGSVSFEALASRFGDDGVLSVTEEITVPQVEALDRATGISNISGAYSFAVQAVEVEVDRATGKVRVLDAVSVHDSGVPINPIGIESQIVGGMAMGLGAALGEELIYEGGRLVNPAYLHYALPRAADLPPIRPILVDSHDEHGPYGAKGVGEIVLVPTSAAVANAVAHATGARIRTLPLTPDRVLSALSEQDGARAKRSYGIARRPGRWWIAGIRWLYPRGLHAFLHRFGTRFARKRPHQDIETIVQPDGVDAAVGALGDGARPIAGGTDLLPARRQGLENATTLVDVTLLPDLGRVTLVGGTLRIGAAARLADLERREGSAIERLLAETASKIASPQIRGMATVAGNLCQQKRCWFYRNDFNCYKRGGASCPCYAVEGDHRFYHAAVGAHRCQAVTPADLATPLIALGATAVVRTASGSNRRVPMAEFYTGPGETCLRKDELLVEVEVPIPEEPPVAAFEKLNLWEGDFAVVSAAVAMTLKDEVVDDIAICVGALANTPLRLRELERAMRGKRPDLGWLEVRLEDTWSRIGHPLRENEWKLDAASGVILTAMRRCLAAAAVDAAFGEGGKKP